MDDVGKICLTLVLHSRLQVTGHLESWSAQEGAGWSRNFPLIRVRAEK